MCVHAYDMRLILQIICGQKLLAVALTSNLTHCDNMQTPCVIMDVKINYFNPLLVQFQTNEKWFPNEYK